MYLCYNCEKEVSDDGKVFREDTCKHCNKDLHVCLNCKFYSKSASNNCIEPIAEYISTKDRANFCDYFVMKDTLSITPKKKNTVTNSIFKGGDTPKSTKDINSIFKDK